MIYSDLVLCTKSYNEQDTLDWIQHYTTFNFDKITIFNNESPIDIHSLLKPYKCDIIDVPGYLDYYNLLDNYCKKSDAFWVFPIDDDEFLYLNETPTNINDFICNYEEFSGLSVNWQCLSAHNTLTRPVPSAIDYCLYGQEPIVSKEQLSSINTHIKCFVQPSRVRNYVAQPHIPALTAGHIVDYDKVITRDVANEKWNNKILLYHYYIKSKEDWDKKMKRGSEGKLYPVDSSFFSTYDQVCTGYTVYDDKLKKYTDSYCR